MSAALEAIEALEWADRERLLSEAPDPDPRIAEIETLLLDLESWSTRAINKMSVPGRGEIRRNALLYRVVERLSDFWESETGREAGTSSHGQQSNWRDGPFVRFCAAAIRPIYDELGAPPPSVDGGWENGSWVRAALGEKKKRRP
ncbi:MAG: hypothetical protein AAF713_22625 [Pseudomonadota bacterium]